MSVARVGLTVMLGLIADRAVAETLHVTATYRDRMSLPAAAVVEASIEDVSRAQSPPASPLDATYWRAVELGGKPLPAQNTAGEAHLVFQAQGRVSGSDGCNRFTGRYRLRNGGVTFGAIAATQMACVANLDVAQRFHEALRDATRWTIVGERMELFDRAGKCVAAFEKGSEASSQGNRPKG